MILIQYFSDFLHKSICCGYSFELHPQVDDKKFTGCNLKTKKLLDRALIGVCAVFRLNMVQIRLLLILRILLL